MAFSWGVFFDIVKTGAQVASAGVDIYAAMETRKAAEKEQAIKAAEMRRQQSLEAARAKREARIKTASLLASQGAAGVRASSTAFSVVGIGSSLQSGLEELQQRTQFNLDSLSAQTKATKAQATADMFGAGIELVADAANFSDKLTFSFSADDPEEVVGLPTFVDESVGRTA